MKFFSALLLCSILFAAALSSDAAVINGQNYVPLDEWGRANGLQAVWIKRDGEIELTNQAVRLVFYVNSAESEINGVNVRLSFPVADAKGVALIAQFDIDSALRPLLYPAGYVNHDRITTICLDPGHGGKDTGNRVHSFFWHDEKTYTLALAFELRAQLQKLGFKVIMTRSSDTYVDLPVRPEIANKAGADLFISLHFNATQTDPDEVQGPETYCITPVGAASSNSQGEGADHGPTPANRYEHSSLLFAYEMQKALVGNLHVVDRDVRRARFAVLRDAQMPAILIEGGYMTNPTEGKKIFSAAYRKQMAAAMVQGILAFQRLTAPAVQPTAKKVPK